MGASKAERRALTDRVLRIVAEDGDQVTIATAEAMAAELLERRAAARPDDAAVERVARAVEGLLRVRNETEATYEAAYNFTFKSGPGRDAWTEVIGALAALRREA